MKTLPTFRANKAYILISKRSFSDKCELDIIYKLSKNTYRLEYYAYNDPDPRWTSSLFTKAELKRLHKWHKWQVIGVIS